MRRLRCGRQRSVARGKCTIPLTHLQLEISREYDIQSGGQIVVFCNEMDCVQDTVRVWTSSAQP